MIKPGKRRKRSLISVYFHCCRGCMTSEQAGFL
uniref:Uncharacterized protein n=1 Tax=Populus trichocarpa TaxID=3694 RepID=A0A3N7G816_POPTR